MSSLNLQVMKPADIYLGEHIKTIAIGDRTKPQSEVANVLEGILTGEGLHQDKFGKQNALVGLNDILSRSPRYKGKVTDVYIVGSGAGHVFPDPLPWEEVDKLCNFYDAEALCLMETYDSDTKITPSVKMVDKKDSEGRTYKEKEYWVEQRVRVQVGFRVYDVVKRTISDQYHFVEEMGWTGKGATEKEAMSRLINKRDATNKVSFAAGNKYGYRISPMWITVSRSYYKKDSKFPQIKRAARMVHVNDWEGAEREWKSLINCGRAKTAGRAAYNLALACEVKGLLEEARGWTMEAYTKYGNKKARDYQRILERRIYDEQRLKEQMEPVNNENNE
ncbi:MAG TPA: DUF6340 family protein [Cytophagaceae bacterium]